MAGHMGCEKTLNRVMVRFYWPGIWTVCRWCASCPGCQLVNQPAIPRALLRPLPLIEVPFERIQMDSTDGPHRAISLVRTRILLCVSSCRLRNTVFRGSAAPHHLCKECGAGTVSSYFPNWDPERDPDWPRHTIYVTNTGRTVRIIGHQVNSNQCLPPSNGRPRWAPE